ncbi:MAG: helix-turn-helix domain-containing protein [Methyloligellaceae bacterium]
MTPKQLRTARRALGLSQAKLATRLGLADGRTIRKWEAEDRDIPQAQAGILEWMHKSHPEWLICQAPDGNQHFIQHVVGPRFMGRVHKNTITEIIWFDQEPEDEDNKLNLIQEAEARLQAG